jgi:hypothetical protein
MNKKEYCNSRSRNQIVMTMWWCDDDFFVFVRVCAAQILRQAIPLEFSLWPWGCCLRCLLYCPYSLLLSLASSHFCSVLARIVILPSRIFDRTHGISILCVFISVIILLARIFQHFPCCKVLHGTHQSWIAHRYHCKKERWCLEGRRFERDQVARRGAVIKTIPLT